MVRPVLVALAIGVQSGGAAAVTSSADACAPGASLRDALSHRYSSARVLKVSDLFEDERSLFHAERPGGCPGMSGGKFFGPKERPSFALMLLSADPTQKIRLVVARPAMSTWTFFEVDELPAGTTATLGTKAGIVTDRTGGKSQTIANDAIVLTAHGSWRKAYVWNGRKFDLLPAAE